MPTYNEYQLAAGHISKATIQASQTYSILSFTRQSDQSLTRPWTLPDDKRSTIPTPARIVRTANGVLKPDGYYAWVWVFTYMTEGQVAYLDTLLSLSDTVWSANCTVQARMRNGTTWEVFQAVVDRPRDLQRSNRGFEQVELNFSMGVKL